MSDRLYVATRKGLFVFDRAAAGRWQVATVAFLGDPITMMLDDAGSGTQYAAARLGHFGVKLYRSSDRAETWHECAAPAYPPQPESDNGSPADPHPWSVDQIWALESAGDGASGTLWAGTNPGGLFCSHDRGESWELNRPLWDHPERLRWTGGGYELPGIHSICIDPADSRRMIVGVSVGGVWKTTDGGASWNSSAAGMRAEYMPPELQYEQTVQDPHRVVQCPSSMEWLYAQHHNGIFVSSDGGDCWNEVETAQPSAFGFAVAVHPGDGRTAWFIPAIKDERRVPVDGKVVVTRTRDGGESFEVLDRGLPGEHAYDLVYRHGLDVSTDGERLAFGSTTGGLWVSENGGDSWTTLSQNLPPVYCVRFAANAGG